MAIDNKTEVQVEEMLLNFAKSFEAMFAMPVRWEVVAYMQEQEVVKRMEDFTKAFLFDETMPTHLIMRSKLKGLADASMAAQQAREKSAQYEIMLRAMEQDEGPAVHEESPLIITDKPQGKKRKK